MNRSDSIQLLRTCLIDSFFRDTYQAVIATLEAKDLEVCLTDGQTCCGQPAYNAGFWNQARLMAQHTILTFEARPGPVVIPSGSCAHMIKHGYPTIFREDTDWLIRANKLAERTYEWSEFLVEVCGVQGFQSSFKGRIGYHASCHLIRGLGVKQAPLLILGNSFPETQVHVLAQDCCGFGGVFSVEQPELSTAILDRKIEELHANAIEIVVGCDVSCLMQIEGRLRRTGSKVRCAHLAQLFVDQEPTLTS